MIYIREAQFLDEIAMNKYNLMVGAHLRGEEVKFYQSFAEIDKLTADDYVFDYVQQSYQLFEWMGLKVPLLDYPDVLQSLYGRKIKTCKIGEIVNNPNTWPVFIKPKDGSKVFTGRVVSSISDLIGIGLPMDYPVWVSEPVEFIREWRCFILHGAVLDVRPYVGDYHVQYDASVIDQVIKLWQDAPCAYSLDIGVTKDGRTLVVEINDGFALGHYGLTPLRALKFQKARWHEITAAYFSEHEVFYFPEENLKY